MAAFASGTSWSFPEDLPGGWVKVEEEDDTPDQTQESESNQRQQEHTTPDPPHPEPRQRTHYPPRQCRICLDVVHPTFYTPEPLSTSLPASLHPKPQVSYTSPPGDGGRLLRPCKCKGSQKYVHEDCLSAWRMQDPLQKRNYWQCPTCQYKYQLQRLTWGSWISSTTAQIGLTVVIFVTAMFALGFVADPIINLYLDPVETIATAGGPTGSLFFEDEPATWTEHFIKGLASLGLLGFAKFLLTLSPWHWFNMRGTGVYVGGGGRAGTTGRDRLSQLSWFTIVVGIVTFLYAVWKGVRAWSRRTLEKAGERVMDVPGNDDDDDDAEE
ncbi:hypothetical protein BDY17DRAFT_305199 [Neohortaea acidophila]|uniref:RING-CH-type domain-containing protein n=1 Tax=Neohortaea acidophila TaxID=245834 RepID=A0A6A6PHG4_9PEZI|nr:uncharacterized protein BDY17DRAFT_305199 [Neohortaea acidophila]KAF2479226.1 hypothetical protein BDY17DRAFT_305199 [Neohortaea acidophila]